MKKFIKMLLAVVAVAFSVNTVFGMGREIKSSRGSAVLAESSVSDVTPDQIFVYFPHPKFFEIVNTTEKSKDNETIFPYGRAIKLDRKIMSTETYARNVFSKNFNLLSQSMYMTSHILYPDGNMPQYVNHDRDFIVLYPALATYGTESSSFWLQQSLELRAIANGDTAAIGTLMREGRLVPLQVVNGEGGYWEYAQKVLQVRGKLCFSENVIPSLHDVECWCTKRTKAKFLNFMDGSIREALYYSAGNPQSESQAQLCRVKIDKDEPNGACLIMADDKKDDDMDFGRGFFKKAHGLDGQEIDLTKGEHVFILLDSSGSMGISLENSGSMRVSRANSGSMSASRADNCLEMLDQTLRKQRSIIAEKRPGTPFYVHIAMFNNRVTAIPELQNVLIADEEGVKQFMQRVRANYCAKDLTAMYAAVNRQVSGLLEYGDGTTTKLDNVTCIIVGDGVETVRNVSKDTMLQSLHSFIERDGSVIVLGVGDCGASMSQTFESLDGKFPYGRFLRRSFSDAEVKEGYDPFHLSLFCFCRFKD